MITLEPAVRFNPMPPTEVVIKKTSGTSSGEISSGFSIFAWKLYKFSRSHYTRKQHITRCKNNAV
jgi:hypothetical protein